MPLKPGLGSIADTRAEMLANNIAGWELDVLERIGRRIKHIGNMSVADIKSINNIADVKGDMEIIMRNLAEITGKNVQEVKKIYADSLEQQGVVNQPLYDYRGKKFVPFAENTYAQAIVNAYAKTTAGEMINLTKSNVIGFYDDTKGFKALEKAYIEALDKAVMAVRSGSTDFNTAMRDTIRFLGGSGVRVNYGSGITRSIESALRQSILYGSKKASEEYDEMIGEELGCDGIEIDWHRNPRPSHEFMQGKQYVLGKARKIDGVFFESADAALKALEDYGCRHYKTSIICSVSEPRYSAEELAKLNERYNQKYEIGGKEYTGYEVTQMMRKLERETRKINKEKVTAEASGDNVLVKDCKSKIKAYRAKYDRICEVTGFSPEYKRMTITRNFDKPFTNQ